MIIPSLPQLCACLGSAIVPPACNLPSLPVPSAHFLLCVVPLPLCLPPCFYHHPMPSPHCLLPIPACILLLPFTCPLALPACHAYHHLHLPTPMLLLSCVGTAGIGTGWFLPACPATTTTTTICSSCPIHLPCLPLVPLPTFHFPLPPPSLPFLQYTFPCIFLFLFLPFYTFHFIHPIHPLHFLHPLPLTHIKCLTTYMHTCNTCLTTHATTYMPYLAPPSGRQWARIKDQDCLKCLPFPLCLTTTLPLPSYLSFAFTLASFPLPYTFA